MTIPIQEIYRQYLRRVISLEDLREWLALSQWAMSEEGQILADEADVGLVHLDDGYGDEDDLRLRLATALEQYTTATVWIDVRPNIGTLLSPARSYLTKTAAETSLIAVAV